MYLSEDIIAWCTSIIENPLARQVAPFAVVFLLPLLVLFSVPAAHRNSIFYSLAMVLESIRLGFPWIWTNVHAASASGHESKRLKKRHARSRTEQIALSSYADRAKDDVHATQGYYPGLVNISGTYCFMNSTLQAMASLSYLQPYIDTIHAKAEALDVPTPVTDALRSLLHTLNFPKSSYSSIRPLEIITALSDHAPGKNNSLFSSREHQDAQELFQLLSECIKKESSAVDKEASRDRGLGGLSQIVGDSNREVGKSVFDGLTANRRSCIECGYTEAVMHFAFDNWQLALPRLAASCALEDCIAEYTKLELLTDCICRKCSMVATHRRLLQEADRLAEAIVADPNSSPSKKKRAKDARRLEMKVKAALDQGRIEDDIKGVKMEKVMSRASTKQAMIARPPPILALHLNRSVHYGQYASKNTIRIIFPEILDLTPYTTSGNLSIVPSYPISSPVPPLLPRSTTPTPATYNIARTLYRLSAVVCHYGQHSFGHYICYRRMPRPASLGPRRFSPPRMVDPIGCECEKCQRLGPIREDDGALDSMYRPGHGWLRVSDDSVSECGIESVLQEGSGAFMLYYERVMQYRPDVTPLQSKSSEETLKPQHPQNSRSSPISVVGDDDSRDARMDGSTMSLASVLSGSMDAKSNISAPRLVRSVAPGRGRSVSAAPSEVTPKAESKDKESSISRIQTPPLTNGDAKQGTSQSSPMKHTASRTPTFSDSPKSSPSKRSQTSHSDSQLTRSLSSPSQQHNTTIYLPAHVQSPQPVHSSSQASPIVGLKA